MPEDRAEGDPLLALLDASPTLILRLDVAGTVVYANRAAHQAFGYAAGALVGRAGDELIVSESHSSHAVWLSDYLQAAEPKPLALGEKVAHRSDGSTFPVDVVVTPLSIGGEPSAFVTLRDLSGRASAERRAVQLGRSYRTLAALNQAIILARDEQQLFDELCRVAVEEGGYLGAWIGCRAEADGTPRLARVASAGGLEDYIARLVIPLDPADARGRGPTATAFREGRPCYAGDFLSDHRTAPWHQLGGGYGIRASATLPVTRAGEVVAVLTLYSGRSNIFDTPTRALLRQLVDNASFAVDRLAATRAVAELARERAELAARLLAAQEAERSRIAADVHDEPIQALAAVELRLGLLERRVAQAAPGLAPGVAEIRGAVEEVVAGLRDLLYELEPASPDAAIPDLLDEACAHVFEHTGTAWRVRVDAEVRLAEHEHYFDPATCGEVLRILREALINARKHAGAASVEVHVGGTSERVEISVSDDGCGIAPEAGSAPGHRGLTTMADRAAVIGADLTIEPRPGGGTVVRVALPRSAGAGRDTRAS